MSDRNLQSISEGGVAGAHVRLPDSALLVGPTVGKELNTLKAGLIPIACWRVEDIRFDFASSFVRPEIASEIKALHNLREEHKKEVPGSGDGKVPVKKSFIFPPLSIFGHADPIGDDDFNKQLSGRRATAIYALLTRRTDLWEELFNQPLANDKWGEASIRTIQTHLGLEPTGKAQAGTRKALFGAYMESLCTIRDEAGNPLKEADGSPVILILDKEKDFLGQGKDNAGKGDFQGCGEFNPMLIFSKEEEQKFAAAQDKTERNQENGPNRRVMALLFRPGSKVEPTKWPCPRVKEGTAACRKRFWSDGEKRRSTHLSGKRREFKGTKDTFACRFYSRLSEQSPCESISKVIFVRLFDPFNDPIPGAPFKVTLGEAVQTGMATTGNTNKSEDDSDQVNLNDPGWAMIKVVGEFSVAFIEWGWPPDDSDEKNEIRLVYSSLVFLKPDKAEEGAAKPDIEQAIGKKLVNLGYSLHAKLEENVIEFQLDNKLPFTGKAADIADIMNTSHDKGNPNPIDPSGSEGSLMDTSAIAGGKLTI